MKNLNGDNLPLALRKKDAHKGDFGHVLLIGGNLGMLGAIGLAALSALRCGAGVATIATHPEHAKGVLSALVPEALVYGISKACDLLPLFQRASVCVLGPGLGTDPWAQTLFEATLETCFPTVIDASALGLLAKNPQKKAHWVLTPHPGEAAALLASSTAAIQGDRLAAVVEIQKKYGGLVVLKGSETLIQTDEKQSFICKRGNPGMATAGMGDILSGLIAGLIAQGLSLAEASKIGVWVHATAGDILAKKQGARGFLAHDLIPLFPLLLNGFNA